MLTDEQINAIGFALEDEGFSHSDIDEYLEHHGVKGMKWGTRRAQKKAANQTRLNSMTPVQRQAHLTKVNRRKSIGKAAIGIGAALVISAGAVYAHEVLKNGAPQLAVANHNLRKSQKKVDDFLNMKGKLKISTLPQVAKENAAAVKEVKRRISDVIPTS